MDDAYMEKAWNEAPGPFEKPDLIKFHPVQDSSALGFHDLPSKNFFQCASAYADSSNRVMGGLEYLVKRSQLSCDFIPPLSHVNWKMPRNHILAQLGIARVASLATHSIRELLPGVYAKISDIGLEDGYHNGVIEVMNACETGATVGAIPRTYHDVEVKKTASDYPSKIQRTTQDLRSTILYSKHSILDNFPYPRPSGDIPHHAYVSIVESIRHYCAHGCAKIGNIDPTLDIKPGQSVDHPTNSPRAMEIVTDAKNIFGDNFEGMLVCYITLWGDDADVGAASMQGKQQIWIKTCTVACQLANGNLLRNTFAVAVGPKGVSHDQVEMRISEELQSLQSPDLAPFYIGANNKICRGYFGMFAELADQLERRSVNHLSYGNATHAARWLVSANHLEIYPLLKSCQDCQRCLATRFRQGDWHLDLPICPNCLNWNVLQDSPLAYVDPPLNYPSTDPLERLVQHGGKAKLKPFHMDHASLKKAVEVAHAGYVTENWKDGTLKEFLSVECVDAKLVEKCLRHAGNAKGLADATGSLLQDLQQDQVERPEEFLPPIPPQWTRPNTGLKLFLDAIMHLLYLGVVKASVLKIQHSLSSRYCNTSFMRANKKYVDGLKHFSIDWLKIMEYKGGKFAGWKSDQYLGFARIMQWFYQNISEAMPEEQEVVDLTDDKDQPKWTAKQNKYWLKLRGFIQTGNALEVRSRVAANMKKTPPPEILEIPVIASEDIELLVTSLSDLLRCVMAKEVTPDIIAKTEYIVRIFLSTYDNLDAKLRNQDDKPSVLKKYNFMSLLNLPRTMEFFGPLRHLWEGSWQGEAFLRKVKAAITQGLRENWQVNLLRNLSRDMSFDNIFRSLGSGAVVGSNFLSANSSKLHKYSSTLEVENVVNEVIRERKKAIPVILVNNNSRNVSKIFVVVGDYISVLEISGGVLEANRPPVVKVGLHYWKFDCSEGVVLWEHEMEKLESARVGYGLLLPLLDQSNNEEHRLFALISSNWLALDGYNNIGRLID